jgi:hypothetical protein
MARYVPKYVSPEQAARDRARRRATLYGILLALPLTFAVLAFGYSDQAPAPLRSAVIAIDKSFGYPIARFLGVAVAP